MDTRLFLACFSALLLLQTSIATHFRGGIITWRTLDPYSDTGNINDTRTVSAMQSEKQKLLNSDPG